MTIGRPIPPITLSPELRQELQGMSRAHSLSQALAQRARIILLADNGLNNTTIARQPLQSLRGQVAAAFPGPRSCGPLR